MPVPLLQFVLLVPPDITSSPLVSVLKMLLPPLVVRLGPPLPSQVSWVVPFVSPDGTLIPPPKNVLPVQVLVL